MNAPPSSLGPYQIIREIARSNDIVYEAYDSLMNRRVAVKELNMPQGSTPQQHEDRVNRFRREAQAAGTLNHANVMTVYSFGEDQGRIFMAMEYLDGQTLRAEMDTKGAMAQDRAVEIAKAVLLGLEHAHGKGVVHRDIKPDNVQILSNGQIKITDFGIARLTFQPNLTMDGQVFGTPSYMSPEQVVGREIDARSDLFSVGVMLYEMLAGVKPFAGDSVVSITYAIMNREPEPLPKVSWSLSQVVLKSLEKSAQLRYSSATDMIRALDDAMRSDTPQQSANPYLQPPAAFGIPPVVAPPVVAPPVFQQPQSAPYNYNQPPVVQQPPIMQPPGQAAYNPYGNPPGGYVPPVAAPPAQYNYSPYQQPGGPSAAPHTPGGMLPPGQVPVYYPPPPRQPLMKPETALFLKRTVIAILIIGTLVAVLLVGLTSLGQAWNRYQANTRLDKRPPMVDVNKPAQEELDRLLKLKEGLPKGADSAPYNQSIASLHERLGKEALDRSNLVLAESHFQRAVDEFPTDPKLHTNLGDLYLRQAKLARDPRVQADFYRRSSDAWLRASAESTDLEASKAYRLTSAEAGYYYAELTARTGNLDDRKEARKHLSALSVYVDPGSDLGRKIDSLLQYLR